MPQIEIDADFLDMKKTPSYEEFIYWQQMKDRKLVFNEGVDEFTIENYILPILKWNEEDEKAGLAADSRKPITLYLNSPGGDIFVGLTLAEVIKKSVTPVHITVLTFACSMASVLLVSGHKRYAYSYANILIHDGQTGISGSSNKVKDHMKYIEKKNEQVKKFILDNSKVTEEKYDSMSDREWWLDATEALELGLIDEII